MPVIAGSTDAYWPARPMTWRTRLGSARSVDAGDPQLAAVGPQQRGDGADERGLAGAVGPEQGGDVAGLGDEVEAVEGVDVAEVLGEAVGLDDRGHGQGVGFVPPTSSPTACDIASPPDVTLSTASCPDDRCQSTVMNRPIETHANSSGAARPERGASTARHLLDVALRMLGDLGEAEDVVQEAFIRLARADVDEIDDVRAGWSPWSAACASTSCGRPGASAGTLDDGPTAAPLEPRPSTAAVDPADRVTLDDSGPPRP